MKILVSYRAIPQSPGWATGDMAVKALRELGHDVTVYAKKYELDEWVEGRPSTLELDTYDLLLFMECNDGEPQYIELKNVRARKKVCWLFDTSYYPDQCKNLVDFFFFDEIFLANPLTIDQYKTWGYDNVHYLPYACDPELHYRPYSKAGKKRDVALIGSVRADREELQRDLLERGLNMELISGSFREKYIDDLAETSIIVNQNPDAGRGLLNMRWFETQAAGSVLFSEHEDERINSNAGLSNYECFEYSYVQDLAACALDLLRDDSLIARITTRGQACVLACHTYQNRCETLLRTVFPHES